MFPELQQPSGLIPSPHVVLGVSPSASFTTISHRNLEESIINLHGCDRYVPLGLSEA